MNADPSILQMKYASVVQELSKVADITLDEALERFYSSRTYVLMREGVADMHCRSDLYLAAEVLSERGRSIARTGDELGTIHQV